MEIAFVGVISCSLSMSFRSGSRLAKSTGENVRPAEAVDLHLHTYGAPDAYRRTPRGFTLGRVVKVAGPGAT
ncbi:hypothetical protein GCM10010156_77230 [Planobispora rosea]|nr:hypothetical protein GCM10010156_77230 [Planobispora rosea]